MKSPQFPGVRLEVRTDDGRFHRVVHLDPARTRRAVALAGIVLSVFGGLLGSWAYFAGQTLEAGRLRQRVAEMQDRERELAQLALTVGELELEASRVRSLFGWDTASVSQELWVPPPTAVAASDTRQLSSSSPVPSTWPLVQAGVVTRQPMMTDDGRAHVGIDIAVPRDSYIRAAADGFVTEVSENEQYGRYVVIEHGDGYLTRYAHASEAFVEEGASVRRAEVIALTGNTGASTGPHLHFEILHNAEPINPLDLVSQPAADPQF